MNFSEWLYQPAPPTEYDRVEAMYREVKKKLNTGENVSFPEMPTETGDANKPIVDKLRQEGYSVEFDSGKDDASGGFWVVGRKELA